MVCAVARPCRPHTGEELKEWLAVNTVDFYNAVSVLYATLEVSQRAVGRVLVA